jgi:predicted ATP-grasp superfamily ATP-dependent carboligase
MSRVSTSRSLDLGAVPASPSPPATAVVLDAHTVSGLAIARSLGRQGLRVVAVVGESPALVAFSRYCREVWRVPSLVEHPAEVAKILETRLQALGETTMLFAPTDPAVLLVNRFRERFAGHTCALPEAGVTEWALDKAKTLRLAQRLGVPAPRTVFREDHASDEEFAAAVPYPCVLKPRMSHYWTADGRIAKGGAVHVFGDREVLLRAVRSHEGPALVAQEFVSGEGRGVYVLAEHGTPRLVFAHRRVREGNPRGSGACAAESVPVDPTLGELACRLLRQLEWHGVAMVEFRVGREPYLMEINGRFWNSLPLSLQSGCDFPFELYRMYSGQPATPQGPYEVGRVARWLRGDLSHVAHALRGRPRGWPGPFPTRRGALRGFLRSSLPGVGSYTFEKDDPLPGVCELWVDFKQRWARS